MAGRFRLIGQGDGSEARVHVPNDRTHASKPGLVVYTHPLEVGDPLLLFFNDESGNPDQNTNASGAGTLVGIHNGGDAVQWTPTANVGAWVFNSTDQAHTGTRSIDATGTRNGDLATFDSGLLLNIGDYSAVRGYIYITSWPSSGSKQFEVGLSQGGALTGSKVLLSSYIDTSVQNAWQLFEIPVVDFGLQDNAFDSLTLDVIDSGRGSAPSAYFDDLALVSAGTSSVKRYTIEPPVGQDWVINRVKWSAVSTSGAIKYNEFFGIPALANGYTFSFESGGVVRQTFTSKNFYDIAQYPNTTLDIISGTASLFEVYFDIPQEQQVLRGDLNQRMVLTVRDDLSNMTRFRASAQGFSRRDI